MSTKITYAITAKNEVEELQELFKVLEDFQIGLADETGTTEVLVLIDGEPSDDWQFMLNVANWIYYRKFDGDFAAHKNYLNSLCNGDWIFQIDADEIPHDYLLEYLPEILDLNGDDLDLIWVPRINIVTGITEEHIQKWRWGVNEKGWVNFPDYQSRLYRNRKDIRWEGRVHEQIVGVDKYTLFPQSEEYCLFHVKDIDRQERQNEYYATIQR